LLREVNEFEDDCFDEFLLSTGPTELETASLEPELAATSAAATPTAAEATTSSAAVTTTSAAISSSAASTTSTSPKITRVIMSSQNFPQIRISDDRNSLYGQFSSTKTHFLFRCKGHAIDGSICSKKYKIKVADFLCETNSSKRSKNGYKKTNLKISRSAEMSALYDSRHWKIYDEQFEFQLSDKSSKQ
jgi:hypothetical protein